MAMLIHLTRHGGRFIAQKDVIVSRVLEEQTGSKFLKLVISAGGDANAKCGAALKRGIRNDDVEAIRILLRPLSEGGGEADPEVGSGATGLTKIPQQGLGQIDETPLVFAIKHGRNDRVVLKFLDLWLQRHQDDHPAQFKRGCDAILKMAKDYNKGYVGDIMGSKNANTIFEHLRAVGAEKI